MSARRSATSAPASAPASHIIDAREIARRTGRDYFTVREWLLSGAIPRIEFPAAKRRRGRSAPRPMRRLLADARDVDAFIERCKVRKG